MLYSAPAPVINNSQTSFPWLRHAVTTVSLCLILVFSMGSHAVFAESLELSIAWLIIQNEDGDVIEVNDFFELLDMDAYVLVPVLPLTERLDLDVQFDRNRQWLLLTHRTSGRTLDIDLDDAFYPGFPEWSEEAPLQFEGEFFVAVEALMYLADVDITWNRRRQELLVIGPWESDRIATDDAYTIPTREEREARVPDVVGPRLSLGSIQYAVELQQRQRPDGEHATTAKSTVYAHGRVASWAVSGGVSAEFSVLTPDFSYSFPTMRAVNTDNNRLIVLGDHSLALPTTLGSIEIRGVYAQLPESTTSKLSAFTTISGPAVPGDTVTVFVNDRQLSSTRIYEGETSYSFDQVPLRIYRINEIAIVIENLIGEVTVESYQLAASPRILQPGTKEYAAFAGLLHGSGEQLWNGQVVGAVAHHAISEDISLRVEGALHRQPGTPGEQPYILSSQMGLAFRLADSVIATLDWIVAGKVDQLSHGANASLLYALERGFFELQVSHVPPAAAAQTEYSAGQTVTARAGWDLSQDWGLQGQVQYRQTLDIADSQRAVSAQVTAVSRGSSQRTTSLTGRVEHREFLTSGIEDAGPASLQQYSIYLDNRRNAPTYSSNWKVGLTHTVLSDSSGRVRRTNALQVDNDLFVRLTPELVLTSGLEGSLNRSAALGTQWDAAWSAGLRWNVAERTFLNVGTKLGIEDEWNGIETELNQVELSLRHLFHAQSSATIGVQYTSTPYSNDRFLTYYAEALHRWADNRGTLNLDLRYLQPWDGDLQSQLRASGTVTWRFPSELELGLRVSRLYSSIYQERPDHLFALFFRQSLSFAPGSVTGQAYSGTGEHNSQVTGVVFLDINGNGLRDHGEPLLADIPMHLDGRSARTDAHGRYRFERLLPGVYAVGLDLRSLPAEYNVVTQERFVQIRSNENAYLEFGVTMSGSLSGQVFLDLNGNGIMDGIDEPIPWVALRVVELNRTVYTRSNGGFYMEGLPLGQHQVEVVLDTLPLGMDVVGDPGFVIDVTPEQPEVRDIDIPVQYSFGR